jgi:hypothetical protein
MSARNRKNTSAFMPGCRASCVPSPAGTRDPGAQSACRTRHVECTQHDSWRLDEHVRTGEQCEGPESSYRAISACRACALAPLRAAGVRSINTRHRPCLATAIRAHA